MKKILPIFVLGAVVLTSCSNEVDDIFDDSAAERLNKTQAKYEALLTASPYGWAFEYYPTSSADDGAVLYALRFLPDGSVDVAGDPFTSGVINHEVSCWDILTDAGPVLSFSTYNQLIHQFADPMDDGNGYEGDYEFSFVHSDTENPDSVIMLKGKKRGLYSRLKMIDEDVTPAEYLTDCRQKMVSLFPTTARNYVVLCIGGDSVRIDDMSTTTPACYLYGKDKVLHAYTNSFLFAKYNGHYEARFNRAFTSTDGKTTARNFIFSDELQQFISVENPEVRICAPHFATFFVDELLSRDAIADQWRLLRNSAKSDQFAEAWNTASNGMSKKSNTLQEIIFSTTNKGDDNNITVGINYKPRTGAAVTQYYKYNLTRQGDVVTLEYVGPYNKGAETMLTNIPDCVTLLEAIEGNYTVENPGDNQLLITQLRLVGENGNSFAVTAKYNAAASATN